MIKFKNIIYESERMDLSFKPFYIRVFKLLSKKGFGVEDLNSVYKFVKSELDLSDKISSLIAILYSKNFRVDGDYEKLSQSEWVMPDEKRLTEKQLALGEYFDLSPFVFLPVIDDDHSEYNYKPIIDVTSPRRKNRIIEGIDIHEYELAKEFAYDKISSDIESDGLDYFSDGFLIDYVSLNYRIARYNAEEITKDEYNSYHNKKESLKRISKESMIENINLFDEYEMVTEDVESYLSEIKELESEKTILNHKLQKIQKEIKLIELDIERLSDTVDYGDDDQEYYSMYDEDIHNLNDKLNRLESIYDEIGNSINDIEKGLAEIDSSMVYLEDTYDMFHDEERFKELYFEKRKEIILEEMEEDISQYAEDANMTIGEAIDEGLLVLDVDVSVLIYKYIKMKGISNILEYNYDSYESDIISFNDEEYYVTFLFSLY